jgi:tetratricopeptide (TPR) repeat protein
MRPVLAHICKASQGGQWLPVRWRCALLVPLFALLALLPACGVVPGYQRHPIPTPTPVILPYNQAVATAEAGNDPAEQLRTYYERGNTHFAIGAYTEAISDYTRVIVLKPTHARAYNNRALVYDTLGQPEQAIADYSAAIRHDPDYLRAYENRLNLRERIGDQAGMAEDYAHLARLDEEHRADYLYQRATLLYDLGDMEGARQAYDATLAANPKHVDALYERAQMKFRAGEVESAIVDLSNALRLSPRALNAYYLRALAYSEREDHASAINDFTRVLELQPGNAKALLGRASASYAIGDHAAARADLDSIPAGALEDEQLQRAARFLRDKLME